MRYTHIPTGLRAESCQERSQGKNDAIALALLEKKLEDKANAKKRLDRQGAYDAKPDASFGRHIRTYRLCGQKKVVDHRTGIEANPDDVLDGKIDVFLVPKK